MIVVYCILFFFILGIDRLSKYLIVHYIDVAYKIFPFLTITHVQNRGISWSFFHSENEIVFGILTSIIALVIAGLSIYTFYRYRQQKTIWPELLILSGALSNLYDRIVFGGVIDFIMLSYQNWVWPIFNMADVAIVLGVGCIVVGSFYENN